MRMLGDIEQRVLSRGIFTDGCWEWGGCRSKSGYGRARVGGVYVWVHRAIMEWVVGRRLETAEQIDHLCRNRACFRPTHLEIVTAGENTRRGIVAKLTDQQVAEVRRLRRSGATTVAIAAEFGISNSHVSRLATGQRRAARGGS